MMKYKEVLTNLVEFKFTAFEEINLLTRTLENKIIRELIIELESKNSEKLFPVIERPQQGKLTL